MGSHMHRYFAPSLNVAITLSLKVHPVGQDPKKAKKLLRKLQVMHLNR